jgi:MFS family permease
MSETRPLTTSDDTLAHATKREWRNPTPVSAFLWGEFAINVGRGYLLVAFMQLLYRTSGGLWHNLLYVASETVFAFIVPFFVGAWVDRNGPGMLLRCSAVGMSAVLLVCAGFTADRPITPAGALFAALATGMLNAGVRVCVFTLLPALTATSDLMRTNGRQQVAFQLGNLVGVLLAGGLVDRIGSSMSFLLSTGFTGVAALCYVMATRGLDIASAQIRRSTAVGFLGLLPVLASKPMLVALFALGASDLVAISVFNLALPVLVATHFDGHSWALASVDSMFTAGSVLLGWVVARFALKGRQLHWLMMLMPGALIGVVLQMLWFDRWVCLGLAFATGFLVSSYTVYFSATIQALVPAGLRGRFAALRRMVSTCIVGVASYGFTASYARYGTQGAVTAATSIGLVVLLASVAWVLKRRMPHIPCADANALVVSSENDDLKRLLEPFFHLCLTDRSRRS